MGGDGPEWFQEYQGIPGNFLGTCVSPEPFRAKGFGQEPLPEDYAIRRKLTADANWLLMKAYF